MNREQIAARLTSPAGYKPSTKTLDKVEAMVREAVEAATDSACTAVIDNLRSREMADALCKEIRGYIRARGERTV